MGGRGVYSYGSKVRLRPEGEASPISEYAVATLNRGVASGTTPEAAIERFREQMMDEKVEYSAYIDGAGYAHTLVSTGKEGETVVAPVAFMRNERGPITLVHNHPHGTSDGRKWGGPFSEDDLRTLVSWHSESSGKVNGIAATAREGTYSAVVRRAPTSKEFGAAVQSAEESLRGVTFQSERAMWRAVNDAYTREFGRIGIDITFTPQKKTRGRFVSQKIREH